MYLYTYKWNWIDLIQLSKLVFVEHLAMLKRKGNKNDHRQQDGMEAAAGQMETVGE